MRILVVGDIHGGLKALRQVLQRAGSQTADRFVFLGDYVDGWSEAAETVAFLIEFARSHRAIFLRGNHDDLCLQWLRDGMDNPLWLQSGGEATRRSYKGVGQDTRREHIHFYEGLRDYYLDAENRIYLHAGFTNLKGVEYEYSTANFYWDRTLWETALSLDPNLSPADLRYPPRLKCYKEIFIGHTPVTRLGKHKPYRAANVWNIDTGAAFKGPLSVMEVNTRIVWQSDPVHTLYPGEFGRNR
jgi:serine/threonine protein phosphatase 1